MGDVMTSTLTLKDRCKTNVKDVLKLHKSFQILEIAKETDFRNLDTFGKWLIRAKFRVDFRKPSTIN